MQQTRVGSLIETLINILIGAGVALASQLLVFPYYGIHVSLGTNLYITAWFTVISVIRGYVIRRYFNKRIQAAALRLGGDNEK